MTRVVEAQSDPGWWYARSRISNNPKKVIKIYLEGRVDQRFFSKNAPPYPVKWQYLREEGKDAVIEKVEQSIRDSVECYGIVDMDSDFDSARVKLPQLIDTQPNCTLFAFIIREVGIDIIDFIGDLINSFVTDGSKATELHRRVNDEESRIIQKMRSRTSKRLYSDQYINHKYRKVEDEFQSEFKDEINDAGINDHVFEQEVANLFSDAGQKTSKEEIRKKLFRYLVNDVGDSKQTRIRIAGKLTAKLKTQIN